MASERAETAKLIIKAVGRGTIMASSLIAPGIATAYKPRSQHFWDQSQIGRGISYTRRCGWTEIRETGTDLEIKLTKKGHIRWQKLLIDQPLRSEKWDQKWRLIIFDIPNRSKNARDALRNSLKRMGMFQLQESVWLTPYPCQHELEALRILYHLSPSAVRLVEATQIEGDDLLRNHFRL
jgi:DNA-binding transcriptional regulator PaaX